MWMLGVEAPPGDLLRPEDHSQTRVMLTRGACAVTWGHCVIWATATADSHVWVLGLTLARVCG